MIDEPARSMAREPNFAAFTTMLPSGRPMTHVMWVDCDGEHLLINTETHRAKFHNVERNPLVAVTIWDRNDPYRYAEVRGRVVDVVRGEAARQHIDELSMRYVDHPTRPTRSASGSSSRSARTASAKRRWEANPRRPSGGPPTSV
ncbi:MAG TPA: TIGR03618 family F420-dependent PPOX class oxidoreductase [Acidimicrobiales bacterium]|nr:TIGR03618 family F420-dependent PPOX class oxidoreductase [Acidimicrobiales bacterium]